MFSMVSFTWPREEPAWDFRILTCVEALEVMAEKWGEKVKWREKVMAEKWGEKVMAEKWGEKVMAEKWGEKVMAEKWGEKVMAEKWGEKVMAEKWGEKVMAEKWGEKVMVEKWGEKVTTRILGALFGGGDGVICGDLGADLGLVVVRGEEGDRGFGWGNGETLGGGGPVGDGGEVVVQDGYRLRD